MCTLRGMGAIGRFEEEPRYIHNKRCITCGHSSMASPTKVGCTNQRHQRAYQRRVGRKKTLGTVNTFQWNLKLKVIGLLGGSCVGCGITDIRLLTVNHKNGGGTKEKHHIGWIYPEIVAGRRTTDDLDLRCYNCQVLYEYEVGRRRVPIPLASRLGLPMIPRRLG